MTAGEMNDIKRGSRAVQPHQQLPGIASGAQDPAAKMNAVLWVAALGSLCVLPTARAFAFIRDLDIEKLSGKWFNVGFMMDQGQGESLNFYPVTMTPQPNGALLLEFEVPENDCQKNQLTFQMDLKPGKYKHVTEKDVSNLYLVDTDYSTYSVVAKELLTMSALLLYSRTPEASEVMKKKYEEFAKCLRFPLERVTYPNNTDPCPQ